MIQRHFLALLVLTSLAAIGSMPGAAQGALPDLVAEEAVTGWSIANFNMVDADQRNVAASERKVNYTGVIAWTSNSEVPGLMLTCNEEKALGATFSVAGVDFGDPAIMNAKTSIKVLKGRLIIDGDRPVGKVQFILRRKLDVVQTMNMQTAYAVVNAIYTGKPVRLETDGRDAVDYVLPPVDDALKEFVANCPAFKNDGE